MRNTKDYSCVQKTLLRIAVIVFVLVSVLFAVGQTRSHAASNFRIKSYYIEMNVNEDDTYDIYEKVKVEFTAPSHGIYRTIPYKTKLVRDGQTSVYYAKITDFKMLSGQPVKLENGSDKALYRIGDKSKYADTITTYEYSYKYDTRGDHLKNGDEVYYNLVGTDWETLDISNVKFKIVFPKDINMANVGMKNGFQETVEFENDGARVISGRTHLNCSTGLTIRAVLPEGYFTRQAKLSNTPLFILIGVLVLAALFGIVLWRRYGVDPQIVEPVEFYPPDGLSAPEVGYLKDGTTKSKHVIAMLLTLADKGYIKIKEIKTKTKFLKREVTEYEIIKLKEYDGNTIGESTFMKGLFKGGFTTVNLKDLQDEFYKTLENIQKKVVKRYEKKLYDKKAADCSALMYIVGSVGVAALVIVSKILNQSPLIIDGDFIVSIMIYLLEIAVPIGGFYMIASRINNVKKTFADILIIISGVIFAAGGFALSYVVDTVMASQLIPFLIGMGACFVLFIVAALCTRKSDYYADVLGKIRGYENFLKTAEKDRMEMLAEEDPDYFYKNLAFAYALGVTSVFAERFASLATRPPEWYDTNGVYNGSSTFSSMHMMNSLDSMMSRASTSMTSSPSSSGGGSFSGGGGGGGGGGGSW